MREYRNRTIQELAVTTCDRCHRRLTPDDPGEWQERLSFDHRCGFYSVFGDGDTVSLDLCQHCVRDVLGEWLCVRPSDDTSAPGGFAQTLMSMPDVGVDSDFERNPQDVLRGSVLSDDDPTETTDIERRTDAEKSQKSS